MTTNTKISSPTSGNWLLPAGLSTRHGGERGRRNRRRRHGRARGASARSRPSTHRTRQRRDNVHPNPSPWNLCCLLLSFFGLFSIWYNIQDDASAPDLSTEHNSVDSTTRDQSLILPKKEEFLSREPSCMAATKSESCHQAF